jgi:hypothetical protein
MFSAYQAESGSAEPWRRAPHDKLVSSSTSGRGPYSVRWIYIQMIEEYARHNGLADLLREGIDGAKGS